VVEGNENECTPNLEKIIRHGRYPVIFRIGIQSLLFGIAVPCCLVGARADQPTHSKQDIYALARDAYLYAYPIVSMDYDHASGD